MPKLKKLNKESKKVTKKIPQDEFDGMPGDQYEGTLLGELTDSYADKKELLAETKQEMGELEERIIGRMKEENLAKIVRSVGGENYEFEIIFGQDDLRCAKITKKPAKKEAVPEFNADDGSQKTSIPKRAGFDAEDDDLAGEDA